MEGYALKKWESTWNLCVHAHGHDVDPIMEASLKINYSLGISSSYIWDRVFCNHGSGHIDIP